MVFIVIPFFQRNIITVSYTHLYILGQLNKEQIKEDVNNAKAQSDVVIVAVHWGKEGHSELSDLQQEYAHYFADLGVDVVIGNHPHLIQPIEKINHTLVIYSLGNFLSTMKDVYNQLEGMVCLDFVKKEDEISIENIQYVPLVNHYNDNVVTIYSLKEYTSTLASQHSILKDQADICLLYTSKIILPKRSLKTSSLYFANSR